MRLFRLCLYLGLSALFIGGCIFAPPIDDGYYVCKLQSDCPETMVCSATLGRCIKQTVPDGGSNCPVAGATRVCYSGPDGTAGTGSCKPGTQTCENGVWTPCQGEILPSPETCNNLDDDCNGQVDDNCPCTDGSQRQCYPGPQGTLNQGSCRAGIQRCAGQQWGPCQNYVAPQPETCDALDNDCNGKVDDVPPRRCYTGPPPTLGLGICQSGLQRCSNGSWGVCTGQVLPKNEICGNRQDDDCDGNVDEGCNGCQPGESQSCYGGPPGTQGRGACRAGIQLCNNRGTWGNCEKQVLPREEVCNGQDDDCNGTIDDGIGVQACYTGPRGTQGQGICRSGRQQCIKGQWSQCIGEVTPQTEICDNADNDCDGAVDNGCQCTPGATRTCYGGPAQTKGIGNCKEGKQVCTAQRTWSSCQGEVTPQKETCNGQDDDCDGNVDGFSERCYTGTPGTENKGLCRSGARTCQAGKWSTCIGEVKPTTEICDGKDNNCDGAIDEKLTRKCYNGLTGCKKDAAGNYTCTGRCKSGNEVCQNGTWSTCQGEVAPIRELCNKVDDDCDGKIDDYEEDCYTATDKGCEPDGKGGFRCKGSCATGKRRCTNGSLSICVGQVSKQPESCDGKDNNCDGQIDEGCQCIAGNSRKCYSGGAGCKSDGKGGYVCQGSCVSGTQTCNQFGQWGTCNGELLPKTETCNGKDDDCDGTIDGMTQRCYTGPANTKGKSPCRDGIQTCTAGSWTACNGQVLPQTETCNGTDDNCDGQIDNGLTAPKCPKQKGVCTGSVQRCGGKAGWLVCSVADYGADYQLLETKCDGKDNDCDGAIDGVGACGKCVLSTQAAVFTNTLPTSCTPTNKCYDQCLSYKGTQYFCRKTHTGGFTYTTYATWLSSCNSKTTCQVSTCASRNFFCDGTRWREGNKPGTNDDFCDGLDNNCNGQIDEGCTCQSPCTADKYCKSPCSRCVQQPGSPFPTCSP